MARLVLTDASPLIGLTRVDGLVWLKSLFGSVKMPSEVRNEVLTQRKLPGEQAIQTALSEGWLETIEPTPTIPDLPDLDEGEAACIRSALAFSDPCLLLMDERAGRAIAREHGLAVAGTAALIGMAKQHGLIDSAREVFERLHSSDFRISPSVIKTILRRVGEQY